LVEAVFTHPALLKAMLDREKGPGFRATFLERLQQPAPEKSNGAHSSKHLEKLGEVHGELHETREKLKTAEADRDRYLHDLGEREIALHDLREGQKALEGQMEENKRLREELQKELKDRRAREELHNQEFVDLQSKNEATAKENDALQKRVSDMEKELLLRHRDHEWEIGLKNAGTVARGEVEMDRAVVTAIDTNVSDRGSAEVGRQYALPQPEVVSGAPATVTQTVESKTIMELQSLKDAIIRFNEAAESSLKQPNYQQYKDSPIDRLILGIFANMNVPAVQAYWNGTGVHPHLTEARELAGHVLDETLEPEKREQQLHDLEALIDSMRPGEENT